MALGDTGRGRTEPAKPVGSARFPWVGVLQILLACVPQELGLVGSAASSQMLLLCVSLLSFMSHVGLMEAGGGC